jgi:hypothetical protein
MAKKKKPIGAGKLQTGSFTTFKQEFSFSLDSITFMSLLEYTIRKEIEETALEMSEDKMCVPKATILKAVKKLGLGNWIPKVPEERPCAS